MNKTDDALSKILNSLADKFGTTVNNLYAIMIKQAYIDGIETILALLFILILGFIYGYKYRKSYKSYIEKKPSYSFSDFADDNIFFTVIGGMLLIAIVITILCGGSQIIDCFFNPEYYALHQIIK